MLQEVDGGFLTLTAECLVALEEDFTLLEFFHFHFRQNWLISESIDLVRMLI